MVNTMRFERRCVVIFLFMNFCSSPMSTYPVVLTVTTGWRSVTLGLGEESGTGFGDGFDRCFCDYQNNCHMPSMSISTPAGRPSPALSAEHAASYRSQKWFRRQYKPVENDSQYEVFCTHELKSSSPSKPCTINITAVCSDGTSVTLTWDSTQTPTVVSFNGVTVIDCCKISSTTTEVTVMSTTPPSIIFSSTHPTTDLTLTSFVDGSPITTVGILQSASPAPDIKTMNNDISGQDIGIIVGAAVVAILITVVIMCILWKIKTRREKNQRKEQTERAIELSGNSEVRRVVYTDIDISAAASSNSDTSITSPSPAVKENHQNSTTTEAVTETQDSEYSHLGTSKVRLENPYNWLDHQMRSTAIQPVIIPAVQIDKNQYTHYLDVSYTRPTNHRVSHATEQAIGAAENRSLYSRLAESKAPLENTYNSLHNLNDEPITETRFTQDSYTANQNSEIRTEPSPSPNDKRDIFPRTSKHTTVEIADVAPCTYTAIIPKTKREKSEDSTQLKNTISQETLTASSSNHPMPQKPNL